MPGRWKVKPIGWIAEVADMLMTPLMYLASGTLIEAPQRTHRWNIEELPRESFRRFDPDMMVIVPGSPDSFDGPRRVKFHVPIFGGWRDYAVIEPEVDVGVWHPGWTTGIDNGGGVSRLRFTDPIRVLKAFGDMYFFGIDAETGKQIPVRLIGEGRIGQGGEFSRVDLV